MLNTRKLPSMCLLAVLATGASASRSADVIFIDPNGFEIEGAGSIQSALPSDTTDMTLLLISAALALTVVGFGVAEELRPKAFANRPHPLNQG
jgi:hypothetical protein